MPTVEVAPKGPRPPIRVRPVPRCDPPFDDEVEPQVWAGSAHQLAFQWPARAQSTAAMHRPAHSPRPEMAAALREAATSAAVGPPNPPINPGLEGPARAPAPVPAGAPFPAGAPVTAGASGDAKLAVRRFVHLCVEVLNGYRPAAHLRRLASPKEAAGVVSQAVAGTSRVAELRRETRPGHRRDRSPGPVGVIRLRLCEPRPGAVEAAVLLVTGERTWAMALRLELHQECWRATTLRLI